MLSPLPPGYQFYHSLLCIVFQFLILRLMGRTITAVLTTFCVQMVSIVPGRLGSQAAAAWGGGPCGAEAVTPDLAPSSLPSGGPLTRPGVCSTEGDGNSLLTSPGTVPRRLVGPHSKARQEAAQASDSHLGSASFCRETLSQSLPATGLVSPSVGT